MKYEYLFVIMNVWLTKFEHLGAEKRCLAYTGLHLAAVNPLFPLPIGHFQQFGQQLRVLPYQQVYGGTVGFQTI